MISDKEIQKVELAIYIKVFKLFVIHFHFPAPLVKLLEFPLEESEEVAGRKATLANSSGFTILL